MEIKEMVCPKCGAKMNFTDITIQYGDFKEVECNNCGYVCYD